MHVLHVIDTMRPGGAQRVLVEIANQTRAEGAAVSVCVTRDGSEMTEKLFSEIAVLVLGRKSRLDWAAMQRLAGHAKDSRVDVVHAHGRTSFALLAFMKSCRLLSLPIVMHDHNGTAVESKPPPLWVRAWGNRHAAQYVSVFDAMDAWGARARIPQHRRGVIPGALDLSQLTAGKHTAIDIRQEFRTKPEVLLGICIGGIRPPKGIDTLLQATARCRLRGAFKIVVVGGVRDASYWSQCLADRKRLGLESEIVFAGERLDVAAWHGQFDFAIHAARSESGPLAVIEHLAAGLPLICTRSGGIARQAERLGVERFVAPEDSGALADAIDELMAASPQRRRLRAQTARQIAHSHFDIRSVMPAWRRVYDNVLASRGRVLRG